MLSIEEAQKNGFYTSTTDELRAYCEQLGIEYHHRHKDDSLREKLCQTLGIVNPHSPRAVTKSLKVTSKSEITPPYNLTGNGKWGGRRHRIKLMRPYGVKLEAGKFFNAGGVKYGIAYDTVTAVPEPVFNLLNTTLRKVSRNVATDVGDGVKERHTVFEETGHAYPFQYLGVDQETADRAGSLMEWYQDKGVAWFRARSRRELEIICRYCDINLHDRYDKPLDDEGLIARVLTHFYSHADAEDAELVAA